MQNVSVCFAATDRKKLWKYWKKGLKVWHGLTWWGMILSLNISGAKMRYVDDYKKALVFFCSTLQGLCACLSSLSILHMDY